MCEIKCDPIRFFQNKPSLFNIGRHFDALVLGQSELSKHCYPKCRLNGGDTDIDSTIGDLAKDNTDQSLGILGMLKQKSLHLSLFVCICLHLSQQLSGMVAIFYYSTNFFKSAGLEETTR